MLEQTVKDDWLNDLLAENGALVSGHPTFSEQLGLTLPVVLRYVYMHSVGKYVVMLTVECEQPQWEQVEYQLKQHKGLVNDLSSVFGDEIAVVLYPTTGSWQFSYTPSKSMSFSTVSSEQLVQILSSKIRGVDQDVNHQGNIQKAINKTINDDFQTWTRAHLSKYCVVNDFDAIKLDNRTLYELKRVDESIDTWEPYLDERSSYQALKFISTKIQYKFRTFSYNTKDDDRVGVHSITNVDRTNISGSRKIFTISTSQFSGSTTYISTRRRQR